MAHLALEKFSTHDDDLTAHAPMTRNGVVMRTAILLGVTAATGAVGWTVLPAFPALLMVAMIASIAGAIVFSIWASRKPLNAKTPALAYAAVQGLLIGAISAQFEAAYSGIVIQALMMTAITVAVTLGMYAAGWVKVTAKFRTIVVMLTASVFAFYLIGFVVYLVTGTLIPGMAINSGFAFVLAILILGIATANLFTDYQVVTDAINAGSDERFEWYAAFGICATVLWVYVQLLRVIAASRR